MPALLMLQHMSPQRRADILAGYGCWLDTLRARPGQILFLTPRIRCLEDPALMAVYAFITGALRALSMLHYQPFTLFQPTLTHQGAGHEDRKQGACRLPEEKPPVPIAKRAGWFALNVLVPVSDISQVGRYTGYNVIRLWQRIRTVTSCRAVACG
ncbi:MAG: hypothetical protein G5701_01570 [Serratia symbiotica]|nr:hypothetical protein [Serratia symbiotica]